MSLMVEVEILIDNHHYKGEPAPRGTILAVTSSRAAMMIGRGVGKKIGVVDEDGEARRFEDAAEQVEEPVEVSDDEEAEESVEAAEEEKDD